MVMDDILINKNYHLLMIRAFCSFSEQEADTRHVMISYQWASQPIMVKVKDKLKQAGYKVWMDVEFMSMDC